MDLLTIQRQLKATKCPEDLFGGPSDGSTITPMYRKLIMIVHPDHFTNDELLHPVAKECFEALTELRSAAERKVQARTYGQTTIEAPPRKTPISPIVLESKKAKYFLVELLEHGDISDIYLATKNDTDERVVVKVVRQGSDNDLAENELRRIEKVWPSKPEEKQLQQLFPEVLESFVIRSPGSQRRVLIMPWYNEYRSLVEVMRVFPDGIDFRDMIWMFKRTLLAIGYAHQKSIIHGAIIPPHVMIHPVTHAIKLVDWSYSVVKPDAKPKTRTTIYDHLDDDIPVHIGAISSAYKSYYPAEVFKKVPAGPEIDIYMAAKCAIALVGGNVETNSIPDSMPKPLREFFKTQLTSDPKTRSKNAWGAHDQINEILTAVVGPRKYRPFPMPGGRA